MTSELKARLILAAEARLQADRDNGKPESIATLAFTLRDGLETVRVEVSEFLSVL